MTASSGAERDPGSFRDPSGFVFHLDGEVFRTLDRPAAEVLGRAADAGILADLVARGLLVDTRRVEPADPAFLRLQTAFPDSAGFLRHERIPFITYPCEWTASMLADAAAAVLELQLALLASGYSLKDASAYNVQFRGCRPVFIDAASIEVPMSVRLWTAYGQFCRMFLFPLYLGRYARQNTKACYLAALDGLTIEETYRMLGGIRAVRPALFVNVFLQYWLQRLGARLGQSARRSVLAPDAKPDARVLAWQLRRLVRRIGGLAPKRAGRSAWTSYVSTRQYTAEGAEQKRRFVEDFLRGTRPKTVLDLGCNTGEHAATAARLGACTVAVDSDHDCVDGLYARSRAEGLDLLPLWMDVANPTPALGFRNIERKRFADRIRAEAVLALALVHHLLVNSRIPLAAIRDFLAELSTTWLLVEFVDVADPMFQQLLAWRENIYGDLTRESFERTFAERFEPVRSAPVPGSQRWLYVYRKRG